MLRRHVDVRLDRAHLAGHAVHIDFRAFLNIADRREHDRPGMLDRSIARIDGVEDVDGMADHRLAQPARFFGGGFGDVGRETLEKFKTVHAFVDMFLDGFARFVFSADDNAAALPALLRHALRPRPVERMAGNPQARPANLALLNAFLLRDDPFGRTVIDVGAGGHAVGEMKLADPFPVMAVPVDQPRQHRLALGVDHLRAARNRNLAALADVLDAPVVKNNYGVFNRRAPRAIDQRAADNGDRSSLRPNRGRKEKDQMKNCNSHMP